MQPLREPATFVIDLGLNVTLGTELGPDYPLQSGLVQVDPRLGKGRGHPAWHTHFVQLDEISFRLWDISRLQPLGGQNFRIISFEARFVDPSDPKKLKSPLGADVSNPIIYDSASIHQVKDKDVIATSVYEGTSDVWLLGSGPPLGSRFQLCHKGIFLLSMFVQVEALEGRFLRTYRMDPEAVVGESEIPPSS